MSVKLAIITPTYNRGDLLPKLKDSLDKQINKKFNWYIIDDGSSDHTDEIVDGWIKNNSNYTIKYFKQSNGGKHRALNFGIPKIEEMYTVIVDSDDLCKCDFVSSIYDSWNKYDSDSEVACVSFLCEDSNGNKVGTLFPFDEVKEKHYKLTYLYNIHGDKVDVYKTAILKRYPFPEIKGEKFCTEELIWNRIGVNYKKVGFNYSIFIHDYFDGGLTSNYSRLQISNYKSMKIYFKERAMLDIPLNIRVSSLISYIKFSFMCIPFLKRLVLGYFK